MRSFIVYFLLLLLPINSYGDAIVFGANESPPFWSQTMFEQGMCGEILQAMSEQAGLQSTIVFKPLKRLIEDTHNNDLGNPDFYLSQQDFASIIPIVSYQATFVYYLPHHSEKIVLRSLDDLKQYKIGILKGSLIDRLSFEKLGIQFETSYSQESIIRKLKLGRIDLALEINLVAYQMIDKLYPHLEDQFIFINIPGSISAIALMLNEELENANSIGDQYKQALSAIIGDGRYQKIIDKHYGRKNINQNWQIELQRFERIYNYEDAE